MGHPEATQRLRDSDVRRMHCGIARVAHKLRMQNDRKTTRKQCGLVKNSMCLEIQRARGPGAACKTERACVLPMG